MIRPMRVSDLPQVADLEARNFSVPWSEAGLRESLENESYLFVVAEAAGKVIGYAGLLQVMEEGDVTNIVVEEAFRGKGIGSLLTGRLMEEGKKRGIRAFTLEVRAGNAAAIHVYEKLGFEPAGIRKRFYERPVEDALIMWKREPEL